MVRFEELQELWQNQPAPESPAVAAESRAITEALLRFRRRQYIINCIKLLVIAWMAWFILSQPDVSWIAVAGLGFFLAGMIGALAADWRIQSAIARLDFTRPSARFVDATLEQLRHPNTRFRRTGWLAIALVTAGINLLLAGRTANEPSAARLVSHSAATLLPFVLFAFGLKLRAKRYAMDYKPLVKRLTAIQAALEEHAR